jgi:hypothetical protein
VQDAFFGDPLTAGDIPVSAECFFERRSRQRRQRLLVQERLEVSSEGEGGEEQGE